jgi:hypothetical protein
MLLREDAYDDLDGDAIEVQLAISLISTRMLQPSICRASQVSTTTLTSLIAVNGIETFPC